MLRLGVSLVTEPAEDTTTLDPASGVRLMLCVLRESDIVGNRSPTCGPLGRGWWWWRQRRWRQRFSHTQPRVRLGGECRPFL